MLTLKILKRRIFPLKGLRAKVTNQIADQTTEGGDTEDSGMPPSLMIDGQVPTKDKKSPKEKTELEIALDGYEIGYQGLSIFFIISFCLAKKPYFNELFGIRVPETPEDLFTHMCQDQPNLKYNLINCVICKTIIKIVFTYHKFDSCYYL